MHITTNKTPLPVGGVPTGPLGFDRRPQMFFCHLFCLKIFLHQYLFLSPPAPPPLGCFRPDLSGLKRSLFTFRVIKVLAFSIRHFLTLSPHPPLQGWTRLGTSRRRRRRGTPWGPQALPPSQPVAEADSWKLESVSKHTTKKKFPSNQFNSFAVVVSYTTWFFVHIWDQNSTRDPLNFRKSGFARTRCCQNVRKYIRMLKSGVFLYWGQEGRKLVILSSIFLILSHCEFNTHTTDPSTSDLLPLPPLPRLSRRRRSLRTSAAFEFYVSFFDFFRYFILRFHFLSSKVFIVPKKIHVKSNFFHHFRFWIHPHVRGISVSPLFLNSRVIFFLHFLFCP